jgi:hypothetical protein
MQKACGYFGAELREFNGEDDHVNLLVEYPPKAAVARLVSSLQSQCAFPVGGPLVFPPVASRCSDDDSSPGRGDEPSGHYCIFGPYGVGDPFW